MPSRRDVPTYDLAPEMSAPRDHRAVLAAIGSGDYDFIIVNYANPDMVGHTGVLGRGGARRRGRSTAAWAWSADAALEAGGALVVTADHGNIEEMRDPAGAPQTQHTTSPVPLVLVGERWRGAILRDGSLADVAPTICAADGAPAGSGHDRPIAAHGLIC